MTSRPRLLPGSCSRRPLRPSHFVRFCVRVERWWNLGGTAGRTRRRVTFFAFVAFILFSALWLSSREFGEVARPLRRHGPLPSSPLDELDELADEALEYDAYLRWLDVGGEGRSSVPERWRRWM